MVIGRLLALIGGFAVVAGTASSVLRTLVFPRGVLSRLSDAVLDATVRLSRLIGDRIADYGRRDGILAWAAPLSLMRPRCRTHCHRAPRPSRASCCLGWVT